MKESQTEPLIPPHGGYRKLKTFQIAELVYDCTVRFCGRFIERNSRTCDQMVQAARSGVQNIVEGSLASGTSRKTEIKLTNVARASLEELRRDYLDFLRQGGLPTWEREDPRRQELVRRRPASAEEVAAWANDLAQSKPGAASARECAANGILTLVEVCTALLERQINAQARQFETNGGFSERMYQRRQRTRGR